MIIHKQHSCHCEPKAKQSAKRCEAKPKQSHLFNEVGDCHVVRLRRTPRNDIKIRKAKSGFTLLETIIACGIMVMAFAIIAVVFGKAYTISGTIKRGSKNQRWGAYLMNTILYGPGKTSTEGLIAAHKIYYPDGTDYPTFAVPSSSYDPTYPNPSRFLCFYSLNGPIIYELANHDLGAGVKAYSLYRNTVASHTSPYSYNPLTDTNYFNLKPTYAKGGKLELYVVDNPDLDSKSSGFYFYKENNTPASTTAEIKRVGIKLVIKNAFQNINQAIVLYQNIRIRNLYSLE